MSVDFNRATGLLILEVVNSNPNGDPDRENDPRQRPNGLGEISPVSVNRKLSSLKSFLAMLMNFIFTPSGQFLLNL